VDNNWLPHDWVVPSFIPLVPGDRIAARVLPKIDIFSYLSNPPALAPLRDDRLYQFPFTVSLQPPQRFWWILPYYGRRYGEFSFNNLSGDGPNSPPDPSTAQTYTIEVRGVNLFPGAQDANGDTPGTSKSIETTLFGGPMVVPPGLLRNELIKSDVEGMFDLIAINLVTDKGIPDLNTVMQLLVSDRIG
jgi:hypothetical protein